MKAARKHALVALAALALAASARAEDAKDDLALDPLEPDFTVVTLPTTLRLPAHKLAFRVTHRFTRDLGQGDFGDLAGDLFAFDSGAQIGLELRFGLRPGIQAGVYRTSDRTIELFLGQSLVAQGKSPVGLAASLSLEGRDNFGRDYSPRAALVVSRRLGTRAALYAVPAFIGNSNLAAAGANDTFVVGLGARVRLGASASLVGELHPRLAGFKGGGGFAPSDTHATFGIEGRVGGHTFQLNFSNNLGTTPAQVARGQQGASGWFLGFGISRKFF